MKSLKKCPKKLMIYKSYIVEKNHNTLKEKLTLFYGENLGLKNYFKKTIKKLNQKKEIINFIQDDLGKKSDVLHNEILNDSLFNNEKIIFINEVNDKILDLIQNIEPKISTQKIYLFAGILDKKSKLRNYFEKSNNTAIVPCYADDERSLKNIIVEKLKGFSPLSNQILNMIVDSSSLDRTKTENEIEKIICCFTDKKLEEKKLGELLNIRQNEDFNELRDQALLGNKLNTNKVMGDTNLETDKSIMYLNLINQRLNKLLEVHKIKKNNLEEAVVSVKPPIFWKDKPVFIHQAQKWNQTKIIEFLDKTYNLEILIKSNSTINQTLLIKKLLIDICNTANSL